MAIWDGEGGLDPGRTNPPVREALVEEWAVDAAARRLPVSCGDSRDLRVEEESDEWIDELLEGLLEDSVAPDDSAAEDEALEGMQEAVDGGEAADEAVEAEELEALELPHLHRVLELEVAVGVCLEAVEKAARLLQRRQWL